MAAHNRRRGYDHRRRSHSRGYDRGYDRHHGRRNHGRHHVSPLTKGLTTLALWAIVIFALVDGAITFTGK